VPIAPAASPPEPTPGDITALVGRYTVLQPLGEHQLRGQCPFCGTAGLRVRPNYGTFHCWSCGHGGDANVFTAHITNHTQL
jgi:DNA primase